MANIVLTNNAKFTPYTFDEMLKPLAMATKEYNAIEAGIAELGSKADLMRMYANEEPNSKVANMYNTYANDLDKQAESLAKYGLNPTSRSNLLGLKRRYSTEITPIETAVTRRRQLAEEQRKALLQNPTLMFERNFNTLSNATSLDRFIENPEYDYGARYSGAQITSDVSKMATNISKELRNYYVGKNVDDYTKTFIKQYGLSSSDIKKFIADPNSEDANKVLSAIYNSALATVPESIRNNYAEEVRDYASKGLWDAVGTDQVSTFEDYAARHPNLPKVSSGGGKKEKEVNIDRMSLFFARDREKLPALLDEEGKLKNTRYVNIDELFSEGKFKKPTKTKEGKEIWTSPGTRLYDDIQEILLRYGYSQEAINNMDRKTVENNLSAIMQENASDVIGRNMYRFSLDKNATQHIFDKVVNRGGDSFEITGLAKEGYIKGSDKLPTETEATIGGDIIFDDLTGDFLIQYNNKYYQLPKNLISNDVKTQAKEWGISYRKAKEYINKASIKKASGEELSSEELQKVMAAKYAILELDAEYGAIGENLLRYLGTKKTNN